MCNTRQDRGKHSLKSPHKRDFPIVRFCVSVSVHNIPEHLKLFCPLPDKYVSTPEMPKPKLARDDLP